MLERIVFRTDFPLDQKFLSEEISASRKTEGKKVIFFLARRRVKGVPVELGDPLGSF